MKGICLARGSPAGCQEVLLNFEADDGLVSPFKLTGSALLDALFSDGDRAGTKPNGFEL